MTIAYSEGEEVSMHRSQQSREISEIISEINTLVRVNDIYGYVFWAWIVFVWPVCAVILLTVVKIDLSIEDFFMIYVGGAIATWVAKSLQGRNIQSLIEIRDRMYEEYKQA